MVRPTNRVRPVLAMITASLVVVGLTGSASAGARADDGTSSVTVVLAAPDAAALSRFAATPATPTASGATATRRTTLAGLLPGLTAHRAVLTQLRQHGFTVTHQTAWTIDATAPTSTVTGLFGPAGAQALPRIPPVIAPYVATVLAASSGAAVVAPRDLCTAQCHDGQDFRHAYATPDTKIHKGSDANGPLTVATLQFPRHGGWDESDLTSYAASVGLPDPVASGQYTQIAVDGLTVPSATSREGGADEEVDLDQESLLSSAPDVNQRAYFDTDPDAAGYADALSQVLADVTQGPGDVGGGDPKIVALSTSWGACESEFSDGFDFPHDTIDAVSSIIESLTAAGVTVFAASGDAGVYDCGDSPSSIKTAVDYPAADPRVVAVGGTRLKNHGSAGSNNGSNWSDTSWSCTSSHTCQGYGPNDTGGSGGGESKLFAQPDYQAAGIGHQSFKTSTGKKGNFGHQPDRLVPDIADDGDPASGFTVLTTDPGDDPGCVRPILPGCQPATLPIGGTSLSSPVAAGLFADLLAKAGATAGVGDIHDALYSAYAAHDGSFRDIDKGSNGNQKDVDKRAKHGHGYELPVHAQTGYDTVTGLGAPLWPAISAYIFDPRAAKATGSLAHPRTSAASHPTVTAHWGARQAAHHGSAPASASVTITRDGADGTIYHHRSAPVSGSYRFRVKSGRAYTLTVVIHDLSGQTDTATAHRTVH
jgi:kumamolisin